MSLHPAPESLFWYWIAERHAIYLRRKAGQPKPWTQDPILQQYKFTNPFREYDRGTVWLRENFLDLHRDDDLGLVAFNICWYRAFNWIGTGATLGWQTAWDPERVKRILTIALASGVQVFTGAHIIRSEFNRPKVDSIVDVCTAIWEKRGVIAQCCRRERSLELAFHYMVTFPYIGPFQAYEMTTDMRHTRLLEDATDTMTWANAGPGAIRGLERLELPSKPQTAACESMRGLLARSKEHLPADFPALEMRDCEHALCETDKYCRVKFGEGKPRMMYAGV